MKRIAISNTIPSEIVYAAGHTVVDLNNVFVTSGSCEEWIEEAEYAGFPKSLCAWIKGVYTACLQANPEAFIGVTEGDCSNTKGLNEILKLRGTPVIHFGYPQDRSRDRLEVEGQKLMVHFGVTSEQVNTTWKRLNEVRKLGIEIDRLTYETNQVSGFENHLMLVSFSDFNGNPDVFEEQLKSFIEEAKAREPRRNELRLAYVGVPPMLGDLYDFTESHGARVVYNEVQREFSMPRHGSASDWVDQYLDYSYPYDNEHRIKEIKEQLALRQIDGIIHYTQAFCHRALDDLIFRDMFDLPLLTLEGDKSGSLDGRSKLRIEAYLDMLKDMRSMK